MQSISGLRDFTGNGREHYRSDVIQSRAEQFNAIKSGLKPFYGAFRLVSGFFECFRGSPGENLK